MSAQDAAAAPGDAPLHAWSSTVIARLSVLVLMLAALPGCEWVLGSGEPMYTESTPITEPWSSLALPVASAKVTFSDADTLSVHHVEGDVPTVGARYAEALTAAGWARQSDTSAGGIFNQTWTREGQSLALSVLDSGEVRVASLSILPF